MQWRVVVALVALSAGLAAAATTSYLRFGDSSTLVSVALDVRALPFLVGFGGASVLTARHCSSGKP
jgi:hypothetical protein